MRSLCPRLFFLLAVAQCSLIACKYNVRDVGFVYLEPLPYRVFGYVPPDAPEKTASTLRNLASASFLDSNVEFRIVDPAKSPDDDTLVYLQNDFSKEHPNLALVSPDGRHLKIPFSDAENEIQASAWSALEGVVSSPLRERLLREIVRVYALVVLVEGADSVENERAHVEAEGAVRDLAAVMDRFPKPVKFPPQIVTVTHEEVSEEKVFLWSLGVEEEQPSEPAVAVLYGRGRRVGPLLRGKSIQQGEIANMLGVLGQDCECDLDRAWMQGPLIPMRWGSDLQAEVLKEIGFDAENPMVKTEVSRILARGPSSGARRVSLPGIDSIDLLGYKEMSLGDPVSETEETILNEDNNAEAPEPVNEPPPPVPSLETEPVAQSDDSTPLPVAGIVALGFLFVSLSGGLLVYFLRRQT